MSVQLGWKVDANACISCRSCEMACKVEYDLKAGQGRRRRVIEKTLNESGTVRTFFLSLACNHCESPACIAACPNSDPSPSSSTDDALYKDDSVSTGTNGLTMGIVKTNPGQCIGCRRCEWACPYGAPQFNPATEKIHKCEMCYQRLENDQLHPSRRVGACVATCIGQAIKQDWVETDPNESYDHTRKDTDDYIAFPLAGNGLLDGTVESGSQVYPAGQSDFVSPGTPGRGSGFVAEANMTRPALKIRNRVYVNRAGTEVE